MTDLPDDVRALLQAVHDALDVPLPNITDADEKAHYQLVAKRAADARIVLASALTRGGDLARAADDLTQWTAQYPVNYTPWQPKDGAR